MFSPIKFLKAEIIVPTFRRTACLPAISTCCQIQSGPKCLVRKFTGLFFTGKILRQFFNGVYDRWVGRWRTEPGLSIRRLTSCSLAFAGGLRGGSSGTGAFSWMAFAFSVYLTSKHRHYLFEIDLVCLVKGVQFATIDV